MLYLARQLNDAVTVTSEFRVTLQVLPDTDVQPRPQPLNNLPLLGAAVRDTEESAAKAAVQVAPQVTPFGELLMPPPPAPPVTFTERLKVEVPCGHPWLAGPSTVTVIVP